MSQIYLSPPHVGKQEFEYLRDAYDSNWIAPVGPYLDKFEKLICEKSQTNGAVALSSGTAALHLALVLAGVKRGDTVFCPSFTFIGSIAAAVHMGVKPVFLDSESASWNLDPALLEHELERCKKINKLPKALIAVHLYGICGDFRKIVDLCEHYGVVLIEDAAESLGSFYDGQPLGSFSDYGIYSFNGNKIITASSGGCLVSNDQAIIDRARFLSTQAKEPYPHYEHVEVGFNYRMSNLLAAVGLGQLESLSEKIQLRKNTFEYYQELFAGVAGVEMMPIPERCQANYWLSCIQVDPVKAGFSREDLRLKLAAANIESRPVWKPMHLQPVFKDAEYVGGEVAQNIFEQGLCLPSGSSLQPQDLERVGAIIKSFF